MNWETIDIPTHPIKNGRWVKAVASIRKNATGEIRRYETEEVLYDGDPHPHTFNWKENNYKCDCNRELFFLRAAGEEEPEDDASHCSEGKFSVNLENPITGEVYYREYT